MHHALLIGEIQLYVFHQISDKRTLSALARTCQTFTEAALDVLWRDLKSFTKLIQCMPRDLWTIGPQTSDLSKGLKRHTLKLQRSITASDWAIFQKYSHRVRSTGVNVPGMALDSTCILALCSPSAPTPLLPNLTSLAWRQDSDVHLLLLARLFSPAILTSLHLLVELESAPPFSFENCPSLKYLHVTGDQHFTSQPDVLERLKWSVNRLQSLETIIWPALGSETILSLSRLPVLKDATFNLPSDFSTYTATLPPRPPLQKLPFSRLRTLTITDHGLTPVAAFLRYFNVLVHLETLNITSTSCPSLATIQGLITALGSSSLCDTLRNLAVCHRSPRDSCVGGYKIDPLLRFHRLESLVLDIRCSFISINDATLGAIPDAWPNISTLFLNKDGPWWPSSAFTTPSGLIRLLEACPRLEQLNLSVNLSSVDRDDSNPLSPGGYTLDSHLTGGPARLRKLVLGPFMVTHPRGVARFLASILPGRVDLSMRWGALGSYEESERTYETGWSLTKRAYYDICDAIRNGGET
ncbi:hypothetical protein BJ138DRAFT_1162238 [Hygrophoropsis aurantiaca]|uniref:Uncharacterized protein n=1 Tax=Hygrophoropsis aurantiaca TaxID=72124 RepID=A0ACB8A0Z3_9AGAM|nr:hypothetical protein BJ138DRAFT_1162238 [Hygrophoropsis aurantiaca]